MSVSYPFWRGNLKKRCHTKAFKIQNDPTRSASLIDLFGLGRVIQVYIQQRVFLPQRAAQKLRRINKEISAMTKKQQADLDDSQPAERRCLFYVLPFSSNACSFTRECNADFYN